MTDVHAGFRCFIQSAECNLSEEGCICQTVMITTKLYIPVTMPSHHVLVFGSPNLQEDIDCISSQCGVKNRLPETQKEFCF